MMNNGLQLNASKTKCMLLHSTRKKVNTCFNLFINGATVEQVRVFKYLGVMVNDTLTWSDHIDMVCRKVSHDLNLLRRFSWFLPRPLLLLYLKSCILPSFDYCDVVWSGCTLENSRCLERLMNFTCKLALRRSRDWSSSAALRDLQLTTLTSRCKLHLAQCMFRCLSFQSPPYLSKLFSYSYSHRKTRSSSTAHLNLPPHLARNHLAFLVPPYGTPYHQSYAWRRTLLFFQLCVNSSLHDFVIIRIIFLTKLHLA